MSNLATRECDCKVAVAMGSKRPERCEHGNRLLTRSQLEFFDKPRKPLAPISRKREAEEEAGIRKKSRGSTLQRSNGFEASPAQRKKVKGLACVGCGKEAGGAWAIDPMHVWPRGKSGCDDPVCVLPGCRNVYTGEGCHRAFDQGELDLLPRLAGSEAWAKEQAHPIAEHGVGLVEPVKRLGGNQTDVITRREEATNVA
jgi:hypothetical protein